ncbi:MAG: family transcriptional regulator [Acidimicrobiales bacterium]|nr:family transcriptional regulator [Acidimicrobiales bacterium]
MPEPAEIAQAIARNVRLLRTDRQWSLDQLAARSAVSKGMLVQIEQARTNPSIGTLSRLADGFGVTLAQLVDISGSAHVRVISAADVVRLWEGAPGSAGDLLAGTDRREHVELWRWRLAAGDAHESEGHLPGTRELLTVITGRLVLEVGDERHEVARDGAVLFDADVPHTYRNEGRAALDLVLVVVQPPSGEPGAASHPG